MSKDRLSIKNDSDSGFGKTATAFAAGLLAFALLAGGAWFLTSKRRAGTGSPPAAATPSVKEVMHLESFVVNLADPSGDCFLRVGVDLGLERSINPHGEKEAAALPTAQVRDVILRVLSTYNSDDLLAPEGKIKLKGELVKSLQGTIPELGVREVYLTDFLVQR
jgi:flagellar FliL protein